ELVAGRPAHGPVAELLAPLQDLLHPHALDPCLAEAAEVARRIRETVGMVDPHAVDDTVAYELDHFSMRRLEHLGVLDAHAREIADVEETADSPGAPLDVEELRPTQGIPPER